MITIFISPLSSSRHFESAFVKSVILPAKDYLKLMHFFIKLIIFSLRSSLFSGKGVVLIRLIRASINGSDYYFLSYDLSKII